MTSPGRPELVALVRDEDATGFLADAEQRLIEASQQFAAYIDERILWVRSAERIDVKDAAAAVRAGQWLLGPAAWRELVVALWAHLAEEPAAVVLLALVVFIPWFALQRRLRDLLLELGKVASARGAQRFRPTARARPWHDSGSHKVGSFVARAGAALHRLRDRPPGPR